MTETPRLEAPTEFWLDTAIPISPAETIVRDIDHMRYLGQVSCYHKLTIGPYDILVDRYTQRVFFVIPQLATTIVEVDVEDPNVYMAIYVAG